MCGARRVLVRVGFAHAAAHVAPCVDVKLVSVCLCVPLCVFVCMCVCRAPPARTLMSTMLKLWSATSRFHRLTRRSSDDRNVSPSEQREREWTW